MVSVVPRKRTFMTKTRQGELLAAGRRALGVHTESQYSDEANGTPRSRRRYTDRAKRKSRRGFAAMDPKLRRKIASMGGRSFHRGPRGFAAMGERQRRQIASEGGRAPHSKPRGFAAMNPREQQAIAARGGRAQRRGTRGR
jgi:hypothetical protein